MKPTSPAARSAYHWERGRAIHLQIEELQRTLDGLRGDRSAHQWVSATAAAWNPYLRLLELYCRNVKRPETDAFYYAMSDEEARDSAAMAVLETCETEAEAQAFSELWTRFLQIELTMDVQLALNARIEPPARYLSDEPVWITSRAALAVWAEVERQRGEVKP